MAAQQDHALRLLKVSDRPIRVINEAFSPSQGTGEQTFAPVEQGEPQSVRHGRKRPISREERLLYLQRSSIRHPNWKVTSRELRRLSGVVCTSDATRTQALRVTAADGCASSVRLWTFRTRCTLSGQQIRAISADRIVTSVVTSGENPPVAIDGSRGL